MRLIDSSRFIRDLTLDTSKGFYGEFVDGSEVAYTSREIDKAIRDTHTISAVPVVRCRECENYDENGNCISLDLLIGIHSDTINYDFCPDPDFYCAYGRRKIETVLPKSDAKDESLEADQ